MGKHPMSPDAERRLTEWPGNRLREVEAHLWAMVVHFGGHHDDPYVQRDVDAAAAYVNRHLSDQDMTARHRKALHNEPGSADRAAAWEREDPEELRRAAEEWAQLGYVAYADFLRMWADGRRDMPLVPRPW